MLILAWCLGGVFVACSMVSIEGYALFLDKLIQKKLTLGYWVTRYLALALFLSAVTLTGLVAYNVWAITLIYLVGIVLCLYTWLYDWLYIRKVKDLVASKSWSFHKADIAWLILPALYFLTRFFSAGLPQQHNDALYYHLAAPKLWIEAGKIILTSAHPSHAQATLWEGIYGLPMFFLGTKGDFCKVVTQVYAQWMHLIVGQIGSTLLLRKILTTFCPGLSKQMGLSIFLAWLFNTLPCVEWTGGLAKNDFIVASYIYLAILKVTGIFSPRRCVKIHCLDDAPSGGENACHLLAGFFAGFAFAIKMSAAGILIALPVLILLRDGFKNILKNGFYFYIPALLAGSALYLRNYIYTGNPVFPAFDSLLGVEWTSQWWKDHNASFVGMFKPDTEMIFWVWNKLLEKNFSKILFVLGCAGVVVRFKKNNQWLLLITILLAFIMMMLRPPADGRYGGFALSLFLAYGFGHLIEVISSKKLVFLFLPLGLFINSPLDILFKIPANYLFYPAEKYVNQFHAYQESKNWMNRNIIVKKDSNESTVIALADKANFYLDVPFETLTEMKSWEKIWYGQSAESFFKKCKSLGYRYFFIQTHFVYPPAFGQDWDDFMKLSNKAKVFESQSVRVMDLNLL